MSGSIKINVTGGTGAIGTVSQGNGATAQGTANITQEVVERNFLAAEKAINELAKEFQKDKEEIAAAIAQLSALKSEAQSDAKDTGKASGILKVVRENYAWAYPAVKDFAKAVWPVVLAAIGI